MLKMATAPRGKHGAWQIPALDAGHRNDLRGLRVSLK
jgi:hypothetical protein